MRISSIWGRWGSYLGYLTSLREHLLSWTDRWLVRVKIGAWPLRLHHVSECSKRLILLWNISRNLLKAIWVWVNLIDSWKSTISCMICWLVVSLIYWFMTAFLLRFHCFIYINIWSDITCLSLSWSFRILWVKYKVSTIISEVTMAIIKTIYMLLEWFVNLSARLFLCWHFHPEVHEQHVFPMVDFLLLFSIMDWALKAQWILKSRHVTILKVGGVSHVDVLGLGTPWLLKPLGVCVWNHSFLQTLAIRSLSVENTDVLRVVDACLL